MAYGKHNGQPLSFKFGSDSYLFCSIMVSEETYRWMAGGVAQGLGTAPAVLARLLPRVPLTCGERALRLTWAFPIHSEVGLPVRSTRARSSLFYRSAYGSM